MHDLLDKGQLINRENALTEKPLLLVAPYGEEGVKSVKEMLVQGHLQEKMQIQTATPESMSNSKFDVLLIVVSYLHELAHLEEDLLALDDSAIANKVLVLLTGTAIGINESKDPRLKQVHVIKAAGAPLVLKRAILQRLAEQEIRSSNNGKKFETGRKTLGEILVEKGLISTADLDNALAYQRESGLRIGECLVRLNLITEQEKLNFLAAQLNVSTATSQQFASAEMDVVSMIPEYIARANTCVALELKGDNLIVAMEDVLDLNLLDSLRDATNNFITPVLGQKDEIEEAIARYYQDISTQKDATDLMEDLGSESVEFLDASDEDEEEINEGASAEQGIVKLVNMLIANAVRDKASDIHVEPEDKLLSVRYRIDGVLRRVMTPPKKSHQAIVTRIKILSNLDIAERRIPQDGRMAVKIKGREIDVRVSILPTVHGEKVVMRILDKESFNKAIQNLGLSPQLMEIFNRQIHKPYGMVIVTGPTGSGKSTTLYSAIQTIKDVSKNIITVEDPVEFHMEGVAQVNVRSKIGLGFNEALRSILRQDPDVILIGEIRDHETADIAVKMALTGHMVFSTLHTNDAISTITRFLDIGVPPLLLGSCLNLIIAQRLVRRICTHCKVEYDPDPGMIRNIKVEIPVDAKFYKGEGCVHCHGTGFSGRLPLFEMIEISPDIRHFIHMGSPVREIYKKAREEGMVSLFEMGVQRAMEGETTLEQVIAVAVEN